MHQHFAADLANHVPNGNCLNEVVPDVSISRSKLIQIDGELTLSIVTKGRVAD
jgi:hypothetical protein